MFNRYKPVKLSDNNNYLKINHNYDKDFTRFKLNNNWSYIIYILPAFVAFISYVNGLTGEFVHDDVYAIKKNPDVLGKNDIMHVFYDDYWGSPIHRDESHKSYRPLTVLTFRLNYLLTGMNSYYFHVVNVCLHGLVTVLFVYTCRHVIGLHEKCACVAGVLFAVHPIHVEAVTGLVGRADVLAAVFYLLTFIAYTRSVVLRNDETRFVPFVTSLALAGVAMLCKETGVTAIGLCIIYDVIKMISQSRKSKTLYKASVLCRIVSATIWTIVLMSFRMRVMGRHLPRFTQSANPASFSDSMAARWMTYGYLWSYNFWLLLSPFKLCYDWQHGSVPLIETLSDTRNLATVVCITGLVYIIFQTIKEWKRLLFQSDDQRSSNNLTLISVAMTTIPFIPASNFLFPVGFVLAERVLYIPSMGFCMCVAIGVFKLYDRWPKYSHQVMSATCFLLVVMLVKTWKQNMIWQSRESLFRSGLQVLPHNAKVHFNYANFLKDSKLVDEAIYHYKTAISLDDHYPSAHNNLATLLSDEFETEKHLRQALKLRPNHQGAHINLGSLLFNRGLRSAGIELVFKAVEIDRTNQEALTTLARCLIEVGNLTQAEYYLKQTLEMNPENFEAHVHYGALYSKQGRHRESAKSYKKAHLLDSTQPVSLVHAAHAHQYQGEFTEAEKLLKRAIDIRPDMNTFEQLAVLYYNAGRKEDSLEVYNHIEKMGENSTDTLYRHAKLLASEGKIERAEQMLSRALFQNDSHLEILKTSAQVKGRLQKHTEAVDILTKAINLSRSLHDDREQLESLYFERGNNYKDLEQYGHALADFEATLRLNPRHQTAHGNCGAIYHLNGDVAKAKYHYNRAAEINPSSTIIKQNLAKLERLLHERGMATG